MKILALIFTLLCIGSWSASAQNALSFDGINDKVDCGNDASVQITGTAISLEAWIYPTSWKPNVFEGNIINKENNGPDAGYMLRCGNNGSLNFNIGSGFWNELTSSVGVLTLNTWQHVAGTYDGAMMRIYVNGVEVGSMPSTVSISNAAQNLTIGNWSLGSGRCFPGAIDEARVWNIPRTQAEINAAMNSEFCNVPNGLVAYYKFNEGVASGVNASISNLSDYSGNNNTGALSTFALSGGSSNWVIGQVATTVAQGTEVVSECNPYMWVDGNTYSSSTTTNAISFFMAGGAANGCDSLVILDLTIGPVTGTDIRVACDSLNWIDGNTYYTSNSSATHTVAGVAAGGCDSLYTLDLTITGPVTGTDSRVACDSLEWIDGNTYYVNNSSATHTVFGVAAGGCDSLYTLDLTMLPPSSGTDTRTECSPYVWVDGNTYTASNNTAMFTYQNASVNGCDSIVTLDLTITPVNVGTTTSGFSISSDVVGGSYQWLDCNNNFSMISGEVNQTFNASANGDFAVIVTENGCADTSACVNIAGIGINENMLLDDFVIHPNPTKGNLSIEFEEVQAELNIRVMSITGKLISTQKIENQKTANLLIDGANGIYVIELIDAENRKATVRIMKEE